MILQSEASSSASPAASSRMLRLRLCFALATANFGVYGVPANKKAALPNQQPETSIRTILRILSSEYYAGVFSFAF